MKTLYLSIFNLLLCLSAALPAVAQSTDHPTSYARRSMPVALEIEWTAHNHGIIQWQHSTDNGATWTDIRNANSPVFEFAATADGLFRARIDTQEACEPTYIVRRVKTIQLSASVASVGVRSAVFNIKGFDARGADIVEYGFCHNLSSMNTRSYRNMPRVPIEAPLPQGTDFALTCQGLAPGTSHSIRPYFKTADGSLIFGPASTVQTLPGVEWSSESWALGKTSMAPAFELMGYDDGVTPEITFGFGPTPDELKTYKVSKIGAGKYKSALILSLKPNTTYVAQAEVVVDGEKQTISKTVKTLPSYADVEVDKTTAGVKHTIAWDKAKTLHPISPAGLQTEYPRVIRVSPDTLLCSYHGGTKGDYWVNVYLQKSYDNGRTWTAPTLLLDKENSTLGRNYWRFTNPEMTKLRNGWIIMSVTANGNPETNENCHVLIMISKDNGETWSDPRIMGRGRTWEPMIIQLPNDELELYVSSEAAWWRTPQQGPQEILCSRSTDNGETWSDLKRSSYSPDRRDGMPVALVMQGNKGILYSIEVVNDGGFGSPSLVHRDLNGEWIGSPWNGVNTDKRWRVDLGAHGGAPSMIQLPTGEIVVMAHVNGRSVWQTSYPRVVVGDSNGKNFTAPVTPITNLPANEGLYYNTLFLKDNETVWLVMTHAVYNGNTRVSGEIKYIEGKIVGF